MSHQLTFVDISNKICSIALEVQKQTGISATKLVNVGIPVVSAAIGAMLMGLSGMLLLGLAGYIFAEAVIKNTTIHLGGASLLVGIARALGI